ncbi:MAG: hypothetical protein EZS28_033227 [Streblomastix strix]|uniref:RRM domain-containing protein n=1 Tax=Streblomastix strix TaxID=222440 RepID=A0A5J4UKR7_9EUKA|nr:MAG: hypothetical protein EZS28_033227 [Streblomastix strix]
MSEEEEEIQDNQDNQGDTAEDEGVEEGEEEQKEPDPGLSVMGFPDVVTKLQLRQYFTQFGIVELVLQERTRDCDPNKAFVFFKDASTIDKILKSGIEYEIVGRKLILKKIQVSDKKAIRQGDPLIDETPPPENKNKNKSKKNKDSNSLSVDKNATAYRGYKTRRFYEQRDYNQTQKRGRNEKREKRNGKQNRRKSQKQKCEQEQEQEQGSGDGKEQEGQQGQEQGQGQEQQEQVQGQEQGQEQGKQKAKRRTRADDDYSN